MIVVDTNVIVHFCIVGERTKQATRAFDHDPNWAAPQLWRSEFLNVLAGYIRNKRISLPQSQEILDQALRVMKGNEMPPSPLHVLELTAVSPCTAYDCEFVALAQDLGVKLVTLDRQILTHFPGTAVELGRFVG